LRKPTHSLCRAFDWSIRPPTRDKTRHHARSVDPAGKQMHAAAASRWTAEPCVGVTSIASQPTKRGLSNLRRTCPTFRRPARFFSPTFPWTCHPRSASSPEQSRGLSSLAAVLLTSSMLSVCGRSGATKLGPSNCDRRCRGHRPHPPSLPWLSYRHSGDSLAT
jgi:hypothetical protein